MIRIYMSIDLSAPVKWRKPFFRYIEVKIQLIVCYPPPVQHAKSTSGTTQTTPSILM